MSAKAALAAVFAIGSMQPVAAQRLARGPQFHPNTQRYSDAGAKPVTGRSGSASLEARALLASDGSALVEVSTGSLDGGTSRGQLRKVQMKVLSPAGRPASTQNFNGLNGGGYWSSSVANVGENTLIELQGNVGGLDGNRTDVVTVTVPVKRRPDIAVDGVSAPARALAGSPLNIVASVSERNGDVGAHATCMLSVDGQLVDQARGIWVAAGQTVSCAFQTNVAAVGSHTISVYTTGISPLDWDPSDNSASTSVEILSPEKPLSYSASFTASDADSYTHSKKTLSDGTVLDEQRKTTTRVSRLLSMTSTTTADKFVSPVQVHSALSADGVSVFDVSNDVVVAPDGTGNECGTVAQPGYFLNVCNILVGTNQRSEVVLSSLAGRVTYFGSHLYTMDDTDVYMDNTSGDSSTGYGAYSVNSLVQPIIELKDARGVLFVARPSITLTSLPINTSYGSCFTTTYNGVTTCSDGTTTGTTRSGSANQ
jgi:hypothetical protein